MSDSNQHYAGYAAHKVIFEIRSQTRFITISNGGCDDEKYQVVCSLIGVQLIRYGWRGTVDTD